MDRQEYKCSACGQKIHNVPGFVYSRGICYWQGRRLILSQKEARAFNLFMHRRGDVLTNKELADFLFGENPRPTDVVNSINVLVRSIRRELRAMQTGFALFSRRKQGYVLMLGIPRPRRYERRKAT